MKPKQYIQGWVEFYKLRFKVSPDVLIPRPETELLVDTVLAYVRSHLDEARNLTILDIGTGCGNIAISIAKHLPTSDVGSSPNKMGTRIIAADISREALKVAKQNAKLYDVEDKIEFVKSNLLSDFHCNLFPVTCNLIIVTNLPYIPSLRIPYLDISVKDFEPHVALDGGDDGFDLYRRLFAQIKENKLTPKLLVCEIDYTQGELAINEAQKDFPEARIEVKTDLAKKQRILLIR